MRLYIIALLAMSCISNAHAATYYVKSGPSNGNGSSWSKAFNNVDSALSAARMHPGSNQIWIATGTYKPSIIYQGGYSGNEANLVTFNLPSNVSIYGGFSGKEMSLGQRDPEANPTILSGDLNGDDINNASNLQTNKSDNAWHVLTTDGVTGVLLDNLIVRDGYANGPDAGTTSGSPQFTMVSLDYAHTSGGGLLVRHGSQITLSNMKFEYNGATAANAKLKSNPALGSPAVASGGGAVSAIDENTLVTIKLSLFDHNNAFNFGGNGGALNTTLEASYDISLSKFTNNSANRNGGAIHGKDAHNIKVSGSKFQNNVITGNAIGDESGGGIGAIDSNLNVSLSLFDSNSASITAGGGGIFFHIPFDDGESYTLNVSGSVFNNNHAGIIGGGAINIFGVQPNAETKAKISTSSFTNNKAINGGALYVDSIPTEISNSSFIGNQANFNGGAIFGSNFGDAILASGLVDLSNRSLLNISSSIFKSNAIIGESPTDPPTLFVVNLFANALSTVFGHPLSSVTVLTAGGGAIATELGGNVRIANSSFLSNIANNAAGGALLVGGSAGTPGEMGQNYVKISTSVCQGNTATIGNNNAVIDPANLGNNPNGVQLVSDGSCQ